MLETLRKYLLPKNGREISELISPTFCVYPWIGFSNNPGWVVPVCCYSTDNYRDNSGKSLNLLEMSPSQVWNHEGVRKIRAQMFHGKKVKGCERCYVSESQGFRSQREMVNDEWLGDKNAADIWGRVHGSAANDFQLKKPPIYLDLRPSNKCNLKCRMCSPSNSSLMEKEIQEMGTENPFLDEQYGKYVRTTYAIRKLSAEQEQIFWNDLNKWVPRLKKVYLTGGEPMILKENWDLIERMISTGAAADAHISFSTNCTVVPEKLKDVFEHFAHITVNFSIDGTGNTQEYIRNPSKWHIIQKNALKIVEMSNSKTSLFLTPTLQFYNAANILELFQWADSVYETTDRFIQVFLLPLSDMPFLNMSTLPKAYRLELADQVKEYREQGPRKEFYTGNSQMLTELVSKLEDDSERFFEDNFEDLIQFTQVFDRKRNERLRERLPDLHARVRDGIDRARYPHLFDMWEAL